MASPASSHPPSQISDAIVAFTAEGQFPESEDVASLPLAPEELPPAIKALEQTKSSLELEIHRINEDTKDDVASWVRNAKSLQEDIVRSKAIANEIIRQSETPDVSGKTIREAEAKFAFLSQEVQYVRQLDDALRSIQHVNSVLSRAEQARNELRILDSLHLLEESWSAMDALPVSKTCRAVKLLDIRSFELKSGVHEVLDQVWKSLVHVDIDHRIIRIQKEGDGTGDQMSLADAVIGLKAYKEVEERMVQLWHNLDVAIITPRMDLKAQSLPLIKRDGDTLTLEGETDTSIESLFPDLATVFSFLAQKLPADLLHIMCSVMMEDVTTRIVKVWLDSSIPPALKDVHKFEKVIESAETFCSVLETHGYFGFDELKNWVSNAPDMWLAKCRATALDSVRAKLSGGIGSSRPVERVEKQMVSLAEGKELANSGAVAASANDQDWDAAWEDDDAHDEPTQDSKRARVDSPTTVHDDGADAWGWDDGPDDVLEEQTGRPEAAEADENDDDDGADAWGWGDEETTEDTQPAAPNPTKAATAPTRKATGDTQTREMVMKETYYVSSMPEPVMSLISTILEDGAALTVEGSEANPVASAASGLFGVPSLALALFRAISPYYYSLDVGGSMYLYNDAMHLADRLAEFSEAWRAREDLSKRARNMLRLDDDVKSLQSFANRAYSTEMSTQKTVVRDLLGGTYNLMQQGDMEQSVDAGIARIRTMAAAWDTILARSVWCQAVGSLVEVLASKIITDIMEMTSIGQDEAYGGANTIAKVTGLDDLFLPSRLSGRAAGEGGAGEVAATAQYAPSWLRMQYLSEVLQSNLNEVRYLWFESELSLYFSAAEVVELVNMSFEENARSKEVVREITQRPHPTQPAA